MRQLTLTLLLLGLTPPAFSQDGCQAPPAACSSPRDLQPAPRDLQAAPRGFYVRAPEVGEQTGESTSYGWRGFGLRLPAVTLDMPELRLPGFTKYRRLPEMQVEASRAPWVGNRALEFNQVPRSLEDTRDVEAVPREPLQNAPRSIERDNCVPPVPGVSAAERRLRAELAEKEEKIQRIEAQFSKMETMVNKLLEAQQNDNLDVTRRQAKQPPRVVQVAAFDEPAQPTPTRKTPTNSKPDKIANPARPRPGVFYVHSPSAVFN